ncbi:MAG: hypothetical protein J6T06_02650 [Victivallales bacterium]|nr:hypothetical protein [Victivallales bacterium]
MVAFFENEYSSWIINHVDKTLGVYALFGGKAVMLHEQWRIMKVKNKKMQRMQKNLLLFRKWRTIFIICIKIDKTGRR